MALAGEYSPKRLRAAVMTMISGGFTVGAAFGGFVAAALIPAFGWQAVFYFGAAIPFVVVVLMIFLLPESPQFLVLHKGARSAIDKCMRRIDPVSPPPSG